MTISELQEKWKQTAKHLGTYLLVSGNHPLSFHVGHEKNGCMCFIVLDTGKNNKIQSSKAISVECQQYKPGRYRLCFVLNLPALDEIFIKLCWDLIDASRDAEDPVKKLVSQYKSWQRLFQQAYDSILPQNSQKGLIGELLFLNSAMDDCGIETALRSWVGPEGADQDFDFPDHWAEVKTVSVAAESAAISSLQQLDRKDDGVLAVYFLDKSTALGAQTISLPEAVEKVRARFGNVVMKDVFNCKLAKVGYLQKDVERYTDRYRFQEVRRYKVIEGFPRLTRSNVPLEIHKASYNLSLAMIAKYKE